MLSQVIPVTPERWKKVEELFEAALPIVESAGIRKWATSERNRPIWVKIAQKAVDHQGPSSDKHMFAAYIVIVAMGM